MKLRDARVIFCLKPADSVSAVDVDGVIEGEVELTCARSRGAYGWAGRNACPAEAVGTGASGTSDQLGLRHLGRRAPQACESRAAHAGRVPIPRGGRL